MASYLRQTIVHLGHCKSEPFRFLAYILKIIVVVESSHRSPLLQDKTRIKIVPNENSQILRKYCRPKGGGFLSSLWYGVVSFFRVPFYDGVRIYGYKFQQFFCFSSSGFTGILFRYFSGFIGGTLTI